MPVLPQSQRNRAPSLDADPLQYLRGVLAFFLGGGAVVALVLALTGVAPKALLLAGLLWALFGVLSGMVDVILGPLAELAGGVLATVGKPSAAPDRLTSMLHRAQLAASSEGPNALLELEAIQREAATLPPSDEIRIGLALAELYEQRLNDPGRALGELRRLIDRYPHLRQTVKLRGLLAALRTQHSSHSAS